MKGGTMYASRLKGVYAKLRESAAKLEENQEPDHPLQRLATAIFAVGSSEEKAHIAVNRMLDAMVDWNDVRISTAGEIMSASGCRGSGSLERCSNLTAALGSIFNNENALTLDHLAAMPRREARHYLEQLDGVDEYATASVVLWSLGGHAIPVDDALLATLRDAELIHPQASRAEVQSFLERHVNASEAKEFCVTIQALVDQKKNEKGDDDATKTKAAAKKTIKKTPQKTVKKAPESKATGKSTEKKSVKKHKK